MAERDDLIALARSEARRAGIPSDVVPTFLAQIEKESNWNPKAVSRAGAKGLGQLMPATARELGVKDAYDPQQNLAGSARYFKQQLDRFGDVGLALAAYNWGQGNVRKMLDNPRSVRIPRETQKYVPSVLEASINYGGKIAPSDVTLAFFPGSGESMRTAAERGVARKTGSAGPIDIAAAIGQGAAPGRGALQAPTPPAAPALPSAATAGGAQPAAKAQPYQEAGTPTTPAEIATATGIPIGNPESTDRAMRNIRTLDDYLKMQFGPLAATVDPFPKGFDSQLMKLIDEA